MLLLFIVVVVVVAKSRLLSALLLMLQLLPLFRLGSCHGQRNANEVSVCDRLCQVCLWCRGIVLDLLGPGGVLQRCSSKASLDPEDVRDEKVKAGQRDHSGPDFALLISPAVATGTSMHFFATQCLLIVKLLEPHVATISVPWSEKIRAPNRRSILLIESSIPRNYQKAYLDQESHGNVWKAWKCLSMWVLGRRSPAMSSHVRHLAGPWVKPWPLPSLE